MVNKFHRTRPDKYFMFLNGDSPFSHLHQIPSFWIRSWNILDTCILLVFAEQREWGVNSDNLKETASFKVDNTTKISCSMLARESSWCFSEEAVCFHKMRPLCFLSRHLNNTHSIESVENKNKMGKTLWELTTWATCHTLIIKKKQTLRNLQASQM